MTSWIVETLLAVTMLMLLALALRRPVARLAGARWAYALWLAPALRFVMPPLPLSVERLPIRLPAELVGAMTGPLPAAAAPLAPAWLIAWGVGAAAFLVWQLASHRGRMREIRAAASPASIPPFHGVPVIASAAAGGVFAVGLRTRSIVVPDDFERRYAPAEQALILEHELVHHRRGDLWCNGLALVILAANWFNPIAYLAFRAFRADQELSCDAAVAARLSAAERYLYAQALVKSVARRAFITACPLNHVDQLKRRLHMLKGAQDRSKRALAGGIAAAAIVAGVFAVAPAAGVVAQAAAPAVALRPPPAPCPAADADTRPRVAIDVGADRALVDCLSGDGAAEEARDRLAAAREALRADAERPALPSPDRTAILVDLVAGPKGPRAR